MSARQVLRFLLAGASLCLVPAGCRSDRPVSNTGPEALVTDAEDEGDEGKDLLSPESEKEKKPEPSWESSCSSAGTKFELTFKSASGDVEEYDMHVAVRWADGKETAVPAIQSWFRPDFMVKSQTPNLCQRIVGHALPNRRVLLWIVRASGSRPDRLILVLLDTASRRVVKAFNDVGEIDAGLNITNGPKGPSVRLIKEWKRKEDGEETPVTALMDIVIQNDQILPNWRP